MICQLNGTFAAVYNPGMIVTIRGMIACPTCQATQQQVKSGFNVSGSQRFLCKQCQRIYTPCPNKNGYSDQVRRLAVQLRQQGMSYRAIGRKLDVGAQTIANWLKIEDGSRTND